MHRDDALFFWQPEVQKYFSMLGLPASPKPDLLVEDGDTISIGNEKLQVKTGNRETLVDKGNDTHTIGQGNREVTISQGNDTLTIKTGNQTIKINAGKSTIEAAQSIELKVGGSTIKITPTGIELKSTTIKLQGQAMVQAQANMTSIKGSAMLELKGGIVKIN